MPVLILARHAKAEPYGRTDFDRELSARGLEQARAAAAMISRRWSPKVAIASAAKRTAQTGAAVAAAAGIELRQDRSLYLGGVEDWEDAINSIPPESECAYIVGHQPTVAEVIGRLAPEAGVPEPFRPSSIAVFTIERWGIAEGEYPVPEITSF